MVPKLYRGNQMKFSSFQTDPTKELEGVDIPVAEGLVLKIGRYGTPRFDDHMRRISTVHQRGLQTGSISSEVLEDLQKRVMAHHVLLGWTNLQDADGKEIPYSKDKAYELMKESRDFFLLVRNLSQQQDHFRLESVETATGNSQAC